MASLFFQPALQRLPAWAGTLAAVAIVASMTACGDGGGGDTPAATSSISGPSRAVADTMYTYQANLPDVAGPDAITWEWGDGSLENKNSTIKKVWRIAGSFNVTAGTVSANGDRVEASQAVTVVGAPIAAGGKHTCALSDSGLVGCWGSNSQGQLGNELGMSNDRTFSAELVKVMDLNGAVSVATGNLHSCALQASGTVLCWGMNNFGQLGNGTIVNSTATVSVLGPTDATALAVGEDHGCAVSLKAFIVRCWGKNDNGQVGNGKTATSVLNPQVVPDLNFLSAVTAGRLHTCALQFGGKVFCWGANSNGQLGNGTKNNSAVPVEVPGLSDVVAISAGSLHTCALQATGTVQCWGNNAARQLGNDAGDTSSSPVAVNGLRDVVALSAGYTHTCALQGNGALLCWGSNGSGELGNGTVTQQPVSIPTPPRTLAGVVAVKAGTANTCALKADGNMLCWGDNNLGQLGDGTRAAKAVPTPVSGGAIFWK